MNNDSIGQWLKNRHINDATIEQFGIHWDQYIIIPINDPDGKFIFNKYRRHPFLDTKGPKYWYDAGGEVSLFGAEFIKDKQTVVICEGELDALVLWSHNIPAVSSTGGAMSWNHDRFDPLLKDKEVYICLDNDHAGAAGSVKILSELPQAKVIILPDTAQVKDVTDYYMRGGDLRTLMPAAKRYLSEQDVATDMSARKGSWQSILFHEAWIEWWEKKNAKLAPAPKPHGVVGDAVENARRVPIWSVVKMNRNRKALCPFHNDKHPSMHIFPDNHAFCFVCSKRADVIDIYREVHSCTFMEAVQALNKI